MPEVKVGDRVLFSPEPCHAIETDLRRGPTYGEHPFHWVHLKAGARNLGDGAGVVYHKAGDVVRHHSREGLRLVKVGDVFHTNDGHEVEVGPPRACWPATVVAVNPDGTVDLDISHPFGHTIHTPSRDPWPGPSGSEPANYVPPGKRAGVPHDAGAKKARTYHFEGE